MTKNKEDEEGIDAESLADNEEESSRRGMLKRIGLATAALAAMGLTSSKASAQGRTIKGDPPSKEEILASLKKQGITNLEDLASRIATPDSRPRNAKWAIWVKNKVVIYDDAK